MKAFDVHDQPLIEGAYKTGQPPHVHAAIMAAVIGFKDRLNALPDGLPELDGRPQLILSPHANFFDEYCVKLVLQDIANQTGKVVSVHLVGDKKKTDHPSSPDVVFD